MKYTLSKKNFRPLPSPPLNTTLVNGFRTTILSIFDVYTWKTLALNAAKGGVKLNPDPRRYSATRPSVCLFTNKFVRLLSTSLIVLKSTSST